MGPEFPTGGQGRRRVSLAGLFKRFKRRALRRLPAFALAFGLSRFVKSMVFGIAPTEPVVYLATAGLLLGIALLAVLVPVLRAVRVDPLVALREGG